MPRNNMIILNRGDTYEFELTIADENAADGKYYLQGKDTVYFGIMDPHQYFEDALVRKKFTKEDLDEFGVLNIVITPEDTLDLLPGTYYYAIKIHLNHEEFEVDSFKKIDKVNTIINKTKLFLCD